MATVKEITHDSSTTLSDFYSTIVDIDGALSVTPAAALAGSTNGVNVDYDAGTNFITLQEDFGPLATDQFRWRFRLDFSNMAWAAAGASNMVQFFLRAGGSNVFLIVWTRTSTKLEIASVQYYSDSAGMTNLSGSNGVGFPDSGDTCVELRAIRETADGNADGEVEFFINGVSQASASNLDNFNRFNLGISRFRLQFNSGDADDTGNLYYDEMILDNVDTADLGCGADVLTLSIIPKPASVDASGTFIYLALLNNGTPILSKFSTALDAGGTTVFDPGGGDVIGVECGRFDDQVVWIAGLFSGTDQVAKSEDAGGSFTVKNVGFNAGGVFAFDVGPDSDEKVIVNNNDTQTLETTDDGATWTVTTTTNIEALSIDRLAKNTQETIFGNFGGATDSINYSINSGADIEDFQTGVFPNEDVTGVIVN